MNTGKQQSTTQKTASRTGKFVAAAALLLVLTGCASTPTFTPMTLANGWESCVAR